MADEEETPPASTEAAGDDSEPVAERVRQANEALVDGLVSPNLSKALEGLRASIGKSNVFRDAGKLSTSSPTIQAAAARALRSQRGSAEGLRAAGELAKVRAATPTPALDAWDEMNEVQRERDAAERQRLDEARDRELKGLALSEALVAEQRRAAGIQAKLLDDQLAQRVRSEADARASHRLEVAVLVVSVLALLVGVLAIIFQR